MIKSALGGFRCLLAPRDVIMASESPEVELWRHRGGRRSKPRGCVDENTSVGLVTTWSPSVALLSWFGQIWQVRLRNYCWLSLSVEQGLKVFVSLKLKKNCVWNVALESCILQILKKTVINVKRICSQDFSPGQKSITVLNFRLN